MPTVNYDVVKDDYLSLYHSCQIIKEREAAVKCAVARVLFGKERYLNVAREIGGISVIPWYFIGAIHNMERGCSFSHHLHNGDPLTARTKQVPSGRPVEPPWDNAKVYSWEQSAVDALKLKKLDEWADWSIVGLLYQLERFNGFGYRLYHPHVKSPYLWSFTNHYTRGKYVADGKWSDVAVSEQVGCVAVIKSMEMSGLL